VPAPIGAEGIGAAGIVGGEISGVTSGIAAHRGSSGLVGMPESGSPSAAAVWGVAPVPAIPTSAIAAAVRAIASGTIEATFGIDSCSLSMFATVSEFRQHGMRELAIHKKSSD
jgi:hypothetical protein